MPGAASMQVMAGYGGTPLALTQKGYGHVYDTSETSDLSMSYANVDGGSAPAAGDLVVWIFMAIDSVGQPILDLTGSGWVQEKSYITSIGGGTLLAKVVTAGDVSSPPLVVDDPEFGSIGFWVAYSISGSVSSVTVNSFTWDFSSAAAPANQVVDSSALNDSSIAITVAAGGGSDDSPSLAISGASADITFTSSNNQWVTSGAETRFMVNATAGGAAITFSKGDDGNSNHLLSGYVAVS